MTHLNDIVEAIKEEVNGYNDYITVIITVLLGNEEEVIEAETIIYDNIDSDDLPCKSARIKMSDWKGKARE